MVRCEDVKTSRLSIGCKVIMRFRHHSYRAETETVVVSKAACALAGLGLGQETESANTGGKEPRSGLNVDSEPLTLPESYLLISKVRNF